MDKNPLQAVAMMKAAKENHTVGIDSMAHTETWERGFQA